MRGKYSVCLEQMWTKTTGLPTGTLSHEQTKITFHQSYSEDMSHRAMGSNPNASKIYIFFYLGVATAADVIYVMLQFIPALSPTFFCPH